jgi:hypothetical protein
MENIIGLSGVDGKKDKDCIESNSDNQGIFILMNQKEKLDVYLGAMHEDMGLTNKDLSRLKICRQFIFSKEEENVVSVVFGGEDQGQKQYVNSMLELLKVLDPAKKSMITIENDDRALLAEIMQQLVYIEYSISNFEIRLANEVRDANKTEIFMKNIDEILRQIHIAGENIRQMQVDEKLMETVKKVGEFFKEIEAQAEKAKKIEMKIAVAASKKTGKSVIANSMFGMELAPTSLEMATPNTCIYKKSTNNKFSVAIGDQKKEFDQKDEICKYIDSKFREAQNDASHRFAIEDMIIEYPTNRNNFESYTIYDTPGPDAAGTDHHKSTDKAVKECDVIIFAIDFSKYLTNSEEKFLSDVKKIFEEKGKFHTLIFCINKIDLMFQDKEPVSKIKKIEFIRNRLQAIDEKYKDCVLFGTSALNYFNTLEIEEKEDQYEVLRGIGEIDFAKNRDFFDDASDEIKDDETVTILSNIEGTVKDLRRQLKYNSVTIDTIQDFSGMPQLLNYVSYIAKNKARKEIVNSITFAISSQMSQIRDEINRRENLRVYIQANEEKKRKIKEALRSYNQKFHQIAASDNFTEGDIRCVGELKEGKIKSYFKEFMEKNRNKANIKLSDFFDFIRGFVKFDDSETKDVIQEVQDRIEVLFRKNLEDVRGQYVDTERLEITSTMVEEAFRFAWTQKINKKIVDMQQILENCIEGIGDILCNRFYQLRAVRTECTDRLKRNDIEFELASIPDFTPAICIPGVNQFKIALTQQFFIGRGIAKENKIGGIHQFFRNLTKNNFDFSKKEVMLTDQIIEGILKQVKGEKLEVEIHRSLIPEIRKGYVELEGKVGQEIDKIIQEFKKINDRNVEDISEWIEKIDNTKEIDELNERFRFEQRGLDEIAQNAEGFMKLWREVEKG